MSNKKKAFYAIYKGLGGKNGAVQFRLNPFYANRERPVGCIFVEAAPAIDKNTYDWDNGKISMALGIPDIGEIISSLRTGCKLFHKDERNGLSKTFELSVGDERNGKPTWMLNITQTGGAEDKQRKVSLPITSGEMAVLDNLLKTALSLIIGWNSELPKREDYREDTDRVGTETSGQ